MKEHKTRKEIFAFLCVLLRLFLRSETALYLSPFVFYFDCMKSLEEVEADIQALPPHKQEELRDWLENFLEDKLVLKEDFKAEIQAGIADVAKGHYRVRKP